MNRFGIQYLFVLLLSLSFSGEVLAYYRRIQKPTHEGRSFHATGSYIGKLVKVSPDRGVIFGTPEVEITAGSFNDSNRYVGSSRFLSIGTNDYETLQKLKDIEADRDEVYIFDYIVKHPLNPEIEDYHTQIVDVRKLESFDDLDLPKEMEASRTRYGSYSASDRQGRIMDVWRMKGAYIGFWDRDCYITLLQGGMGSSYRAGSYSVSERKTTMWLDGGEEMCQYAEKLARTGDTVSVEYEQQLFEIWDHSTYVVKKIKHIGKEKSPQSTVDVISNDDDFDALKKRLLEDEEFMNALSEELNKNNSKKID